MVPTAQGLWRTVMQGCLCVCRGGELGTAQLLWGISAFAQMLLRELRAGSRNFSFNLASKFGKGGLGFLLEGKELTGKHGLSRPPPPCTDRGTIYKRPILLGTERQERHVCE